MAQNISKGIKELLAEANAQIKAVAPKEAQLLAMRDDHVLIDLRDIREIKRSGKIPGAFSCPRGMLEFWIDPQSPYHKEVFNQDKSYLFYCASGWRSALSTRVAQEMGLAPVAHIEGGFTAWLEAGGAVEMLE